MGVDGSWWVPWTSNPVTGSGPVRGGFDSHILPPIKQELRVSISEALFYYLFIGIIGIVRSEWLVCAKTHSKEVAAMSVEQVKLTQLSSKAG